MATDAIHARHLAQLSLLKNILDEADLLTTMLEKSEAIPIHVLMVGIQQDEEDRDRYLHFSFLPLNEEEIQAVQLLQIYCTLPIELEADKKDALASLMLEINTRLPIGHFGINEQNEIHYRYVYSLSGSKTFEADEILEIVSLFIYMIDMFSGPVEGLANGSVDLATSLAELR
jgi:hypothetical protein